MPSCVVHPPVPEPSLRGRCALAVMIKAPRPGQSKTRLSPPLSPEQATTLSRTFYQDTAELLAAAASIDPFGVQVAAYSPAGAESEFVGLVRSDTILVAQRNVGFGDRLRGVVEDLLAVGCEAVALIDSDSPTVPLACYLELLEVLKTDSQAAVVGPTDDGGYYVLGVRRAIPHLFEGIAWSTDQVFPQTLAAIERAGLHVHLLPRWHDVDDSIGLDLLAREFRGEAPGRTGGFFAPRTRTFMEALRARGDNAPAVVPGS